jgi:hypothetical protein
MPSLKQPLQQPNKYKVSARQWKKWPDLAQRVFNETYEVLLNNQRLYLHPGQDPARKEYWTTTAWNAAWTAADAAVAALDGIVLGQGYARQRS